ncbi:MAG: hypothetical protein FWC66_05145 [Oscillospiraceae bacterium]|nr:hypothetical protein [Oscillospiraceae bacterium]
MVDRISTKVTPNNAIRFAEEDESGVLLGHRYFRLDDEPEVEGTPINKATLLDDIVSAALNLAGDNATPNNALAELLALFNGIDGSRLIPRAMTPNINDWIREAPPGLYIGDAQSTVVGVPGVSRFQVLGINLFDAWNIILAFNLNPEPVIRLRWSVGGTVHPWQDILLVPQNGRVSPSQGGTGVATLAGSNSLLSTLFGTFNPAISAVPVLGNGWANNGHASSAHLRTFLGLPATGRMSRFQDGIYVGTGAANNFVPTDFHPMMIFINNADGGFTTHAVPPAPVGAGGFPQAGNLWGSPPRSFVNRLATGFETIRMPTFGDDHGSNPLNAAGVTYRWVVIG